MKEAKSDLVYVVEDLNREHTEVVHAQRMLYYPALCSHDEVTQELRDQFAFSSRKEHLVKSLREVRERYGNFEVLVTWEGWEEDEGST